MERWLDVVGHEGKYKVSNMGNVKNRHGRILKPGHSNGYHIVGLCSKSKAIHRLVLMSFVRLPGKEEVCNHINGKKGDNRLCNLEWCSHAYNMRHARRSGLVKLRDYVGDHVSLMVNKDLVKKLKILAIRADTTLQGLTEKILEKEINMIQKKEEKDVYSSQG